MDKKEYKNYEDKASEYYKKRKFPKHIEKVQEISLLLSDIVELNDDERRLVSLGAILHDIGKSKNKSVKKFIKKQGKCKHNVSGAKYLKTKFFSDDISNEEKEIICNMVRYHRGKFKDVPAKHKKLVAIVRLADKISKVYKLEDK